MCVVGKITRKTCYNNRPLWWHSKLSFFFFFTFFCHLVHNLCSYTVWILCATERAVKSGTNSKVQLDLNHRGIILSWLHQTLTKLINARTRQIHYHSGDDLISSLFWLMGDEFYMRPFLKSQFQVWKCTSLFQGDNGCFSLNYWTYPD